MSQLILMIAKIDELDNPENLTELWRQAMPTPDLSDITPAHYLNELESQVTEIGWEAMRHLMVEQWQLTDGLLVEKFRREQAGAVVGDGYDLLKVASRMGVLQLPRQVCYLPGNERHTLPGNAGLPEKGKSPREACKNGFACCQGICPLAQRSVCWAGWHMSRK